VQKFSRVHELQRFEKLVHDVLLMNFLENIGPDDCYKKGQSKGAREHHEWLVDVKEQLVPACKSVSMYSNIR
jgi:hypothetical protein